MGNSENFFIPNNDIQLEAEYYESSSNKSSAVLICHPHPQIN